jgi:acetyl esterase/lipase
VKLAPVAVLVTAFVVSACSGAPASAPTARSSPPPTASVVAPTASLVAPTASVVPPTASVVPPTPTDQSAESLSPPVASIDPGLPAPDAVDRKGTCAGGPLCLLVDVATWRSIPFTPEVACSSTGATCRVVANIYGPTRPGDWPLFVLVSGADAYETPDSADSAYIDDFAKQLAGRGAVVVRANWRRGPGQGAGFPASFADIACAIGVSRNIGARYGAATSHVVLVGHSSGGWAAAIVGLTRTPFDPAAGSCNETSGSLRPDAWAGMAPAVDYASSTFVGGTKDQKSDAWAAVDPYALAAHTTPADRLPVTLIQGGADHPLDVSTRRFQAALIAAGIDSTLVEEPAANHPGILNTVESVDALMELAALT